MKFTIDRAKWRCGGDRESIRERGKGLTKLLNKSGFMCCLGQVCRQLGLPKAAILGVCFPGDVDDDAKNRKKLVGVLVDNYYNSSLLSERAVRINDNERLTDAEREQQLTVLFAKHGHEIEFVGEFAER